ncbi:hypothetical protein AGMMS49938_12860 [Fibrobacterales bacterium]|nr:hypothetical protein AGMMS49938_12860 [Fibrobacterales bacterium]
MQVRLTIDGKEYEGNLAQVLRVERREALTNSREFLTFNDKRDGRNYKYVKIGRQFWMAQNLNFEAEDSFCYDNNPEQGELYGRLYSWATALGVCPLGWHLPTLAEWQELADFSGVQTAATALKSISGWVSDYGGTDDYGFAALPAGYRSEGSKEFHYLGKLAGWWSSSDVSAEKAFSVRFHSSAGQIRSDEFHKLSAFSVRCVRD